MADLALVTSGALNITKSMEQYTAPFAEAISLGEAVRIDISTGKLTGSNASSEAEAASIGVATSNGNTGGVTVLRKGILDGFDVSAMAYYDPVYLSDTDGKLSTTPGTVPIRVGWVIPGFATTLGTSPDKLLYVDFSTVPNQMAGTRVVTSELLAASVDKWAFIADRPYKVMKIEEIHSVVGGAAAAVRPRKVTDTSAPGAAAGANVKELTQAAFDLTATINTTRRQAHCRPQPPTSCLLPATRSASTFRVLSPAWWAWL
jgi:hypothetical protein